MRANFWTTVMTKRAHFRPILFINLQTTDDVDPPIPTSSSASNSNILSIHAENLETVEAALDDGGSDATVDKKKFKITPTLSVVSIFSAFGGFVFGYDLGLMGYID